MANKRESLVKQYYKRIDADDLDWVVSFFSPDACYDRASAEFRGIGAIEAFFRYDRGLSGTHYLSTIWSVQNSVFAEGTFIGKNRYSDPVEVEYTDHWIIQDDMKVHYRRTELFRGAEGLITKSAA